MKTVSVSDLKAHLSQYLRTVQRGTEVQILDRGVPVARLVPAGGVADPINRRLDRLIAAGVVRKGAGNARRALATPPVAAPGADLRRALAEDREDRT